RLPEHLAGAAAATVDPRARRLGVPAVVGLHAAGGAPAGLEQVLVVLAHGQARAPDGGHPRAGCRVVGLPLTDGVDLVAAVAAGVEDTDALERGLHEQRV